MSKDDKADKNLYPLLSVFTLREVDAFKEDHLYRDIEPTVSYQLETLHLTKNFSLTCLGNRMSPSGQIYLYEATSKPNASTIRELDEYVHKICTRGLGMELNF